MAAKKSNSKGFKPRAKATRKVSTRSLRIAPRKLVNPPNAIATF
jgi:hypothetical protein